MSDILIEKKHHFKAINTDPLRDKNLSFKARGVLAMLLTMPNDWKGQIYHLENSSKKDGKKAIRSALKELVESGYAEIKTYPKIDGKFQGKYYNFFDTKKRIKKDEL